MAFTKENASQMAVLSHKPDSARFLREITEQNEAEEAKAFRLARLSRVRAQLIRLDKQLAEESDPSRLDRLMSALNRLQEAEGWLAGRAKPGNLKPAAPRPPKASAFNPPPPADDVPAG